MNKTQEELYEKALLKQKQKLSTDKPKYIKKASYVVYNVCLLAPESLNRATSEMLYRVLKNNFPKLDLLVTCGDTGHPIGLTTDGDIDILTKYIAGLIRSFLNQQRKGEYDVQ